MHALLSQLLQLYIFCIFGRIILSWFPIEPGSVFATIFTFLYRITEPVLGPARRMLPSMGAFDISPIVVILALEIIGGAIVNSIG